LTLHKGKDDAPSIEYERGWQGNMINWCIENPLEDKPLVLNDSKMIVLEAYITWERRGVPFGKPEVN